MTTARVARDHDVDQAVPSGFLPDRINGVESRLGKCGTHFRLKPPVRFSSCQSAV